MSTSTSTPMVEARGVHKHYGGVVVLKGVDLNVARGEVTCLIGPSGSGKSTLLRCINHLEKHDAGELRVDGELVGYVARGGKLYELWPTRFASRATATSPHMSDEFKAATRAAPLPAQAATTCTRLGRRVRSFD